MSQIEPSTTYCGHPRYACPFCAYDTLEPEKFRAHVAAIHPTHETKPARPAEPMTVERKRTPPKPAKE